MIFWIMKIIMLAEMVLPHQGLCIITSLVKKGRLWKWAED